MRRWMPALVLALAALLSRLPAGSQEPAKTPPDQAQTAIQKVASDLYGALNDDQKKKALHPFDSPHRNQILFPGAPRPGLQIKELNADQKKQVRAFLASFLSDYGVKKADGILAQVLNENKANATADQTGLDFYYVNFFGVPSEKEPWAIRIAEHHLTIVYLVSVPGQPMRIGPILLGANPPNLWYEMEDAGIAAYKTLSDAKAAGALLPGKKESGSPMGDGVGVPVGKIPEAARPAVKALFDEWLKVFSAPVQAHVRAILDAQGGLDALRFAYWGEGTARCEAGGKFDWKLEGPAFLCDFENTRGHVHLCLKGEAAAR